MEEEINPGKGAETFTVTMNEDWHISHDSPASSGDVRISDISQQVINIPGGDSGQVLTADNSGLQWTIPGQSTYPPYHIGGGIDPITPSFSIEDLEKRCENLQRELDQLRATIKLMNDHAEASKCKPRKLNINKDE